MNDDEAAIFMQHPVKADVVHTSSNRPVNVNMNENRGSIFKHDTMIGNWSTIPNSVNSQEDIMVQYARALLQKGKGSQYTPTSMKEMDEKLVRLVVSGQDQGLNVLGGIQKNMLKPVRSQQPTGMQTFQDVPMNPQERMVHMEHEFRSKIELIRQFIHHPCADGLNDQFIGKVVSAILVIRQEFPRLFSYNYDKLCGVGCCYKELNNVIEKIIVRRRKLMEEEEKDSRRELHSSINEDDYFMKRKNAKKLLDRFTTVFKPLVGLKIQEMKKKLYRKEPTSVGLSEAEKHNLRHRIFVLRQKWKIND
jgi:hypothetical protein